MRCGHGSAGGLLPRSESWISNCILHGISNVGGRVWVLAPGVGRIWDVSRRLLPFAVAAGYDENLEPMDSRLGCIVAADLEQYFQDWTQDPGRIRIRLNHLALHVNVGSRSWVRDPNSTFNDPRLDCH